MHVLRTLACVPMLTTASSQDLNVDVPLWHPGDTHEHYQLCISDPASSCTQARVGLEDIFDSMILNNLRAASVLVWAKGQQDTAYSDAGAYDLFRLCLDYGVTGAPVTGTPFDTDPSRTLQVGIETSGLDVADLGHLIALRVDSPASVDLRSLRVGPFACPDANGEAPDPDNDGSGDLAREAIAFLRSNNPDVAIGYAHQFWPEELYDTSGYPASGLVDWQELLVPAGYALDAKCLFNPGTQDGLKLVMRPIPGEFDQRPYTLFPDALFRRIDFIEAHQLARPIPDKLRTCQPHNPAAEMCYSEYAEEWWYGAYHLLQNVGVRVSAVAGSDANCVPQHCLGRPRTYVNYDDTVNALTYDAWVDGVVEGRTSLAVGPSAMLTLAVGVNGEYGPGDQVDLFTQGGIPPTIRVQATLHMADDAVILGYDEDCRNEPPIDLDAIEILVNGDLVEAGTSLPIGGTGAIYSGTTLDKVITISESSWISARLKSNRAYATAVYCYVNYQPIKSCEDAEYLVMYCDLQDYHLSDTCATSPGVCDAILLDECPDTKQELQFEFSAARRVFARMRDYMHDDVPDQVVRVGRSTYACRGPIPIGVDDTVTAGPVQPGQPPSSSVFYTFHGPPNTSGVLLEGGKFRTVPLVVGGAENFIGQQTRSFLVTTDASGFAEVSVEFVPNLSGQKRYYQFIWDANTECSGGTLQSSSDVLEVKIQGSLGS